jgi:phosphoribosyl 1,2-cyclic phosphodiesterase/anti-sigma regulatory factor (Ser/Thr protein kinase)
MKVHFWGSRGSVPVSLTEQDVRAKIAAALREALRCGISRTDDIERFIDHNLPFAVRGSYGGNTACVEIADGDAFVLCDAGTGLRDFGNHAVQNSAKDEFHIFLSHTHWDHIQGFPFFAPAYIPGNRITIYGFHGELEQIFRSQQDGRTFPVPLGAMPAQLRFIVMEPGREYQIAGFRVTGMRQNHPGDSYGYAFERSGRKVVYATDSEHTEDVWGEERSVVEFFRGADLLIFDAQYSFLESAHVKENWGHSSNILGVELGVAAGVRRLCLFHNEPDCDDGMLDRFLKDTRDYLKIYDETSPMEIDLAYDGLELEIGPARKRAIRLDADMDNLGGLIAFADAFAREEGMAPEKATDLAVAIEEAFVNICRYAYEGEPGNVEVNLFDEDGGAVVEIIDAGIPFDITAQGEPDLTADIEARKVGGLGCFLIRKLMDRVEYRRENGKNILRLTSVPPREAESKR